MKYFYKIVVRLVRVVPINCFRIWMLRKVGVKIGHGCKLFSADWGTEPYLIKLGNHVVISNNVRFLTHDGAVWVFRKEFPSLDIFGSIKVGNNVCIGFNSILLPNTEIGDNCIIAAGSVVKGRIPSNSVVFGNPGKVVLSTEMQKRLVLLSKFKFNSKGMSYLEKKKMLQDFFENRDKKRR
ncbi:acyltransferase [Thermophagus sp. OGC60D27]|uniref:acyltransferase n=1 Tax=Thermophagus sp. OGC60D27 TaxID=3458415 RepID=UPI0040384828